MYKALFQPISIGKVKIKNRIAMAPMGIFGLTTPDGCYTQRAIDYYIERARGGVGLIITGAAKVENEIEKFKPGILPVPLENPSHFIATAAEMNEYIHAYGAKIFLQLSLGFGRVAKPHHMVTEAVAPSALPNYWNPEVTCRELTTREVETLVKRSAETAEVALEAGFDGVEIHAVHEGYLLDQFTMVMFNRRQDKYGGDLMGRLTFPLEVVRAIKKRVGQHFPVSLRYSVKSYIKDWNSGALPGEDFCEKGRDTQEGLEAAKILAEAGYDAINADGGSYEAWYWAHPPVYQKHGCYLPLTEQLKKVVNIPVLVAGRMDIPALAENALLEGQADMVAIGRGLLADPHWPNKVKEGQINRIRPCLACHQGCIGRIGKPRSCAVNPACGREREYGIEPAHHQKKVIVVGGGIAGMEAARVAALRGHQVTLYEMSSKLGGHVLEAAVPDFKADELKLLLWYENELRELQVQVKLNEEGTLQAIKAQNPAAVIIATGSKPTAPQIPGIDGKNVAYATEVLLGIKETGEKVAVVGGGLVGCETALWLAQLGKKPVIIEKEGNLLSAGGQVPHMNRIMLIDLLQQHKVKSYLHTVVTQISTKEVVIMDKDFQTTRLPADTVVFATGLKPETALYQDLESEMASLYLIGDAKNPVNIMNAIWEGYLVARTV